jgi:hypothetical protein
VTQVKKSGAVRQLINAIVSPSLAVGAGAAPAACTRRRRRARSVPHGGGRVRRAEVTVCMPSQV